MPKGSAMTSMLHIIHAQCYAYFLYYIQSDPGGKRLRVDGRCSQEIQVQLNRCHMSKEECSDLVFICFPFYLLFLLSVLLRVKTGTRKISRCNSEQVLWV